MLSCAFLSNSSLSCHKYKFPSKPPRTVEENGAIDGHPEAAWRQIFKRGRSKEIQAVDDKKKTAETSRVTSKFMRFGCDGENSTQLSKNLQLHSMMKEVHLIRQPHPELYER